MHCPRIVKVCLNVGLGKARYEEKFLESTLRDLCFLYLNKAHNALKKSLHLLSDVYFLAR